MAQGIMYPKLRSHEVTHAILLFPRNKLGQSNFISLWKLNLKQQPGRWKKLGAENLRRKGFQDLMQRQKFLKVSPLWSQNGKENFAVNIEEYERKGPVKLHSSV